MFLVGRVIGLDVALGRGLLISDWGHQTVAFAVGREVSQEEFDRLRRGMLVTYEEAIAASGRVIATNIVPIVPGADAKADEPDELAETEH